MISSIVARRYARTLFTIAKEAGKLEEFAEQLGTITGFLEQEPEIQEVLESPVFPPDLKGRIADELLKAVGAGDELTRFIQLLVERRRIQVIRAIQRF